MLRMAYSYYDHDLPHEIIEYAGNFGSDVEIGHTTSFMIDAVMKTHRFYRPTKRILWPNGYELLVRRLSRNPPKVAWRAVQSWRFSAWCLTSLILIVATAGLVQACGVSFGSAIDSFFDWRGLDAYFLPSLAMVDAILFIAPRWVIRRLFVKARNVNYVMCLECGYTLIGHADEGRCPECGTAYTGETLKQGWLRLVGLGTTLDLAPRVET